MNTSDKKLSVLIPFKNERDEVARTCKSVRDTAGDRVDIIVLNDDSDKDYDYKTALAPYNVQYYESDIRLGSSLGKQRCVELCRTPYFLILDAHCRIYTQDWLDRALAVLSRDEDCVYCCAVQYFSDETDHQSPNHMKAYGGYWDYNIKSILSCGWNTKNLLCLDKYVAKSKRTFDIPCILGANYICSKRWWDYLGGFNGLLLYGREETFISKKSWMAGGKVQCIPGIHTGHKTRPGNHQPYHCSSYEVLHNEMVCAYILFNFDMFAKLMKVWTNIHNEAVMRDATKLLLTHMTELADLKRRFNQIKKVEHSELDKFNAEFQTRIGFNYKRLKEKIKGTYTLCNSGKKVNIPVF